MVLQRGPKLPQPGKAQVGIARDGGSVLVAIDGTGRDDREGVVRGRHAGRLDLSLENVIDKGGFARRVVADQQDKREGGAAVRVRREGTVELFVYIDRSIEMDRWM